MNLQGINFDIYAMARPKSRKDCEALAREILAELAIIEGHIDAAIARCESSSALDRASA